MNNWKNFYTVAYAEFWDRINYYGLQSILVLYLTQKLGFSDNESLNLFGSYVSLAFGLTILGGFFADKIIGVFNATILGALLIFIGNIIFTHSTHLSFYLGLVFIIMGIGLLKPSNPTLIGFMCDGDSYLRTKLFSIFYFCLNMGCILGPIVYGFAMQIGSFEVCYFLSGFGILSAVIVLLIRKTSFRKQVEPQRKLEIKNILFITIVILISIAICTFLLIQHNSFFCFLLSIFIIATFYSIKTFKLLSLSERKSVALLIVPFVSSIIFFTTLLQLYSSITFYAERNLDKHIFGWTIPTAWFSSIEPIFVSLLIPILTYIWKWLDSKKIVAQAESKIITGLVFASTAFAIFALSALFKHQSITALLIVVLANAFLAIGELSIIPISMSLTNSLAPQRLKGTLMGLYYFVLMLSGYLASQIAKFSPPNQIIQINFSEFFMLIAGLLLFTALSMYLLKYLLQTKN